MNKSPNLNTTEKAKTFFDANASFEDKKHIIDTQQSIDQLDIEARWSTVKEKIGNEGIYKAFREYFEKMFNKGVLEWVGSLYDSETGLFYSSLSAKNAEKLASGTGYYPHLEATSVALRSLANTGALRNFGGDYTKVLPEIMMYKIMYYLKTIQEPSGEFYVPQMPRETIAPERVGRDHAAARNILSMLKVAPTYDIGGFKGDGIDGETYWANLVAEGKVRAEDKPTIYRAKENIVPNTEDSRTEASPKKEPQTEKKSNDVSAIIESHDSFVAHLLTKDPYNNPYGAISNINSIAGIVNSASLELGAYDPSGDPLAVARTVPVKVGDECKELIILNGDTLNDINIKWMNLYINEAGLFGKITDHRDESGNPIYDGFYGGWGFNNSNGFMKGISRYFSAEIAFPEPRKAAESLLKGLANPEKACDNGNVLVIYNVWNSLSQLRANIKQLYTGDDKQQILDYITSTLENKVNVVTDESIDIPYAALAIERAYEQVQPFRKVDGGYGHNPRTGTPTWQGGLPVGVAEENLSDTDATFCTMTSLSISICGVFGINMSEEVPMYSEADLYRCLYVMSLQPRVIKKFPHELA